MINVAIEKCKILYGKIYNVPWCLPSWGKEEFKSTLICFLTRSIIHGSYPDRFSKKILNLLGMRYAITTNRGRAAIEIALRAMNIGRGDGVVLPTYVCSAVLEAVHAVEAEPQFADIDSSLHVNKKTVSDAIAENTKCVIVAHLFGNVAPIDDIIDSLKDTGIFVIDDAAQSFGAKIKDQHIGSFGDCGVVSCGPGKTLSGVAGAVLVIKSHSLYNRALKFSLPEERPVDVLRRVRSFWIWRRFRRYTLPLSAILSGLGILKEIEQKHITSRISNLDAAIALNQLESYENKVKVRKGNILTLLSVYPQLKSYTLKNINQGTFLKLVLVVDNTYNAHYTAEQLMTSLDRLGVECQTGYSPLHIKASGVELSLPFSETIHDKVVCVPVDKIYKTLKTKKSLM